MKQYEYMFRSDKDVFEGENRVHYVIEVTTNNYECYQELKEGIAAVIAEYEERETKREEVVNENQD